MIVQRIQCYHYNEAFNIPFHSPQANRLRADSVIVCLDCGSYGCGWGESAPRPYVTGEDIQSVLRLWEQVFAPILFEHEFNSLDDIERLLSRLEKACQERGYDTYNSALGSADLALIDVLRRGGLLEEKHIFPSNYRETLRFSVSVPFIDFSVIKNIFPLLNEKFDNPIIKLLIGRDSEDNKKRLGLMRRLAGEAAEIRLEVNGKLERDQVLREIDHLRSFNPVAIEQPFPAGDIEGLRHLRKESGLAVIVDESLATLEDAKRLLTAKACDIFNIKISKCGGLLRSMAIARQAQQAGINCQVGTHVGETELLGSIGRQLARGIPNFDCYGGGSHVLFSQILKNGLAGHPPHLPFDDNSATGQPLTVSPFSFLESMTQCLDTKPSN